MALLALIFSLESCCIVDDVLLVVPDADDVDLEEVAVRLLAVAHAEVLLTKVLLLLLLASIFPHGLLLLLCTTGCERRLRLSRFGCWFIIYNMIINSSTKKTFLQKRIVSYQRTMVAYLFEFSNYIRNFLN